MMKKYRYNRKFFISIFLYGYGKSKRKEFKQEENISKWCEAILTDNKDVFKEKVGKMNMSKETKEKLVKRVEELSEEQWIRLYTELSDRELTYNMMIEDVENEGLKKGKKETTINIAKNLINLRISMDDISKSTGLSIEEIKNLE